MRYAKRAQCARLGSVAVVVVRTFVCRAIVVAGVCERLYNTLWTRRPYDDNASVSATVMYTLIRAILRVNYETTIYTRTPTAAPARCCEQTFYDTFI